MTRRVQVFRRSTAVLLGVAVLFLSGLSAAAWAGEISGSIRVDRGPIRPGVRIDIVHGSETFTGYTQRFGLFRVSVPSVGPCRLTVHLQKGDEPSTVVISYRRPATYRLWLVREGAGHRIQRAG
jgi:hypothetical protein